MKNKPPHRHSTTTKPKHMVLTGADAEAFLRELADPSPPTERLVEAVRRYRSLVKTSTDDLVGTDR